MTWKNVYDIMFGENYGKQVFIHYVHNFVRIVIITYAYIQLFKKTERIHTKKLPVVITKR